VMRPIPRIHLIEAIIGFVDGVGAQNSAVLRDVGVFVEQPCEAVASADLEVVLGVWVGKRPQRRGLAEGAVRTVVVEVSLVFGEHRVRVPLVDDEDPVQQLAAEAADEPFGDGVGPRRPNRRQHDLHAGRGEHRVEDLAELVIVVPEEEPERLAGVLEIHDQVTG
jgi:hypothetical protein